MLWTVRHYGMGSGWMECLMDFNELPYNTLHQRSSCVCSKESTIHINIHKYSIWMALYVCVVCVRSEFTVTCACRQDLSSAVDVVPPIDSSIYYIFIISLCEWREIDTSLRKQQQHCACKLSVWWLQHKWMRSPYRVQQKWTNPMRFSHITA